MVFFHDEKMRDKGKNMKQDEVWSVRFISFEGQANRMRNRDVWKCVECANKDNQDRMINIMGYIVMPY